MAPKNLNITFVAIYMVSKHMTCHDSLVNSIKIMGRTVVLKRRPNG